jgi:hypothetical protein
LGTLNIETYGFEYPNISRLAHVLDEPLHTHLDRNTFELLESIGMEHVDDFTMFSGKIIHSDTGIPLDKIYNLQAAAKILILSTHLENLDYVEDILEARRLQEGG